MPKLRTLVVVAACGAATLSAPAWAAAAPPPNDNYLASLPINAAGAQMPPEWHSTVDTTDATTQADLFNPNQYGQQLGGAGPEPTTCKGTSFGKTVWYDFHPPTNGGVDLSAVGFDSVIALYEWNEKTSLITKTVGCSDKPGLEDELLATVEKGKAYTVQIGGVAGPGGAIAGGPLSLELDFFADTDGDGILDADNDKCKTIPGVSQFGGCPPPVGGKSPVSPSLSFANTAGGVQITRFVVAHVPAGAKVKASCAGCGGGQTIAVKKGGTVAIKKLVGRSVRAGSAIELRVTMGRHGKGIYKYGATGAYFKWPVKVGGLGTKVQRCLHVGTAKIERCS